MSTSSNKNPASTGAKILDFMSDKRMEFGQFIQNSDYLDAVITFKIYVDNPNELMPLEERLEITFEQEKKVYNSENFEFHDFKRWVKNKITNDGQMNEEWRSWATQNQEDEQRIVEIQNGNGTTSTITKTYTVHTTKTSRFKNQDFLPIRPENYWNTDIRDFYNTYESTVFSGPEEYKLAKYPGVDTWISCTFLLWPAPDRPWYISRFSMNDTDYGWTYHGKMRTDYTQMGEMHPRKFNSEAEKEKIRKGPGKYHPLLRMNSWGQKKNLPSDWKQIMYRHMDGKWPKHGTMVDRVVTPLQQWQRSSEGWTVGSLNQSKHGTMWFIATKIFFNGIFKECMSVIDRHAEAKYGDGRNAWYIWRDFKRTSHDRLGWMHLRGTKAAWRGYLLSTLRGFHLGRRPQDDGKQNELDINQTYKTHPKMWEHDPDSRKWRIKEGYRPYIELKLRVRRGNRRPQPLNWSFIKNQKTKNDASNTKTSDGNYYKGLKF